MRALWGQRMKLLTLLFGFGFASAAFANVTPPSEMQSRALQQARRVAAMENDHDLPSRGFWLGQRVARNSERLELAKLDAKKPVRKAVKKAKASQEN